MISPFLFYAACAAVVVCATVLPASAAPPETDDRYRTPPPDVVAILNAKPTPTASLSPDRKTLILTDYEAYPPIEMLARPFLGLGGIRIDPTISGEQRTTTYTGMTLLRVADGVKTPLKGLPAGAKIEPPSWSPDGKKFAFARDVEDGIEVWVGDVETATCRVLPGVRVNDVLAGPFLWQDDSRHLLVAHIVPNRGPAPMPSRVPSGPVVSETIGKTSQVATYQDLLKNPFDEKLFDYYGASQIARVDTETGKIEAVGEPGLITSLRPSPDEKFLLVSRLKRPFSYRVPAGYFARTVEVWRADTGQSVRVIADLAVSDEIPKQGVPLGPRSVTWQENRPATLLWVEALDGGDPLTKVPFRDKVMKAEAPFVTRIAPLEVLKVVHRFAGWGWFEKTDEVMLSEYDRDRRWSTTYHLNLADPEKSRSTLFDLSVNDAYNDPGSPVYERRPGGESLILQDGDFIYLSGAGANPDGDRPFLDKFNLKTHEKTRLFQSDKASYESFLAFARTGEGDKGRGDLLTSFQTKTQPANYYVHDLATGLRRALTDNKDPHPQITGMKKELVKYTRAGDNVPLSGMLYLPPDYDPSSGKKLPLVVWAYPREFSDAATAGQVRGSTDTFTRLAGDSPLWFVTQGYAVLNNATMPVVGDPETMNDTFVAQIVGAAKAAIDVLDARGIIDPRRVLVAGHSYGAFMTANLLAHSNLFAAGIARSGAYNRTLTPFGFQSERRSYWEATDIYTKLSPFTYADKIKTPLLLIHGQADNNPGTFTVQSERFYQALQANGATSRLVLLPNESHGYRAKESVQHVLYEMFAWADKYVKNRK